MINKVATLIQRVSDIFRIKEWLYSKLPFMLVPLMMYLTGDSEQSKLRRLALFTSYLFYLLTFLSFGYAINDYCDIEQDKISGKRNMMGNLKKCQAKIKS